MIVGFDLLMTPREPQRGVVRHSASSCRMMRARSVRFGAVSCCTSLLYCWPRRDRVGRQEVLDAERLPGVCCMPDLRSHPVACASQCRAGGGVASTLHRLPLRRRSGIPPGRWRDGSGSILLSARPARAGSCKPSASVPWCSVLPSRHVENPCRWSRTANFRTRRRIRVLHRCCRRLDIATPPSPVPAAEPLVGTLFHGDHRTSSHCLAADGIQIERSERHALGRACDTACEFLTGLVARAPMQCRRAAGSEAARRRGGWRARPVRAVLKTYRKYSQRSSSPTVKPDEPNRPARDHYVDDDRWSISPWLSLRAVVSASLRLRRFQLLVVG